MKTRIWMLYVLIAAISTVNIFTIGSPPGMLGWLSSAFGWGTLAYITYQNRY